jgi:hypothetical protein
MLQLHWAAPLLLVSKFQAWERGSNLFVICNRKVKSDSCSPGLLSSDLSNKYRSRELLMMLELNSCWVISLPSKVCFSWIYKHHRLAASDVTAVKASIPFYTPWRSLSITHHTSWRRSFFQPQYMYTPVCWNLLFCTMARTAPYARDQEYSRYYTVLD